MKKVITKNIGGILLAMMILASLSAFSQTTYEAEILAERDSTNREFSDSTTTILMPEDTASFHGLEYFPVNENFRVMATFKKIKNGKAQKMRTSGTRTPLYKPYGTLTFKLEGKKYKLALYQSADPARPELNDYLLLAFTDSTSGNDTYGGGRYLDYRVSDVREHMVIDFNKCYNPYCAYNHKYSCVIPPLENFLPVRIEAGVKKFHD